MNGNMGMDVGWVEMGLVLLVFLAILDERFARGEIDEEEYLQRRQALLSVHQP